MPLTPEQERQEMGRFARHEAETLLWAKALGPDRRLFDLNPGQGSVPRFPGAAETFVKLVEGHAERFGQAPFFSDEGGRTSCRPALLHPVRSSARGEADDDAPVVEGGGE